MDAGPQPTDVLSIFSKVQMKLHMGVIDRVLDASYEVENMI